MANKPKKTISPKQQQGQGEGKTRSTRAQVMAEDRKRRKRRKKLETLAIAGVTVLVAGLLVGIPLKGWIDQRLLVKDLSSGSCDFDEKSDEGASGRHSEQVSFKVNPPSGGVHTPQTASAGDYSSGQVPPEGQIVHAHEHGYITLWYKPGNDEQLTQLREMYDKHPRDILLVPRESLPVPFAATAWKKRLLCDTFEQDKFQKFFDEYVNEGPEKVPH